MKKITGRAFSVLLLALMIIAGMTLYVIRYADHSREWALAFPRANSGAGGDVTDRNGVVLAAFDATTSAYAEDRGIRMACYHVTGDYWNRSGTGVLGVFWDDLQDYSIVTGTTKNEHKSLRLNIDAELSRVAYEAIGPDRRGAVMMMNYRTGEVLVMVSAPSIDPLDSDAEIPEGAFINRCISATYTPGSVFKLVTSAAAIEDVPNMFSRSFFCEGVYTIAGVDIKCAGEHWTQTFEQALANSCNVAFAQIAVKVGQDSMVRHVTDYGFLDRHELDGIPTAAGNYPTEFVGDPELAWSGIGQSTDLVCPYTLLRFVAAIANDGMLCTPHLLHSDEPPEETRLIEAETAQKLKEMMSYNVTAHYEPEENFPGISYLCAKTGTAELGGGRTSHAWFTGFLDDPEHPYAFVVLIENAGGGLTNAGPVANALLQAAISPED